MTAFQDLYIADADSADATRDPIVVELNAFDKWPHDYVSAV